MPSSGIPVCEQLETRQLMDSALSPDAAVPTLIGPTAASTTEGFHTSTTVEYYKFIAGATGKITVELDSADGLLDPTLRYRSATNRVLRTSGDISRINKNSRLVLSVVEGRTYTVSVEGNRATGGAYSLKLSSTPTDDRGNTRATSRFASLTRSGAFSGRGKINYGGDVDVLAVVAGRSGTMTVNLQTPALAMAPQLAAYDADGTLLTLQQANMNGAGMISLSVTQGTTYYIAVSGSNGLTGAYTYTSTTNPDVPAPMRAAELAVDGRVVGPILLQPGLRTERDIFGYTPLFEPNMASFGPNNQAFIYTAFDPTPTLQVLRGNQWVRLDVATLVRTAMPSFNGRVYGGVGADYRVVFDKDGDAYMPVSTSKGTMLLHSRDGGQNWDANLIAGPLVRVEFPDGGRTLDGPPAILAWLGGAQTKLLLQVPIKNADGTITMPPAVVATDFAQSPGCYVGGSNSVVTVDGKVHVVWADTRAIAGGGTATWGRTLDKATGTLGEPVLLGISGSGAPNAHRVPALTVDSHGYLHLLMGSHNDNLKYMKSLSPNSLEGWSSPVAVGSGWSNTSGRFTYPSLVIDAQDTLHLVVRSIEAGTKYNLVYMRKPADQAWQPPTTLVAAGRSGYALYNQVLNLDRSGRLYLNYSHYTDQMTQEEAAIYRDKYPDEPITPVSTFGSQTYYSGLKSHDPAMITSDDGGATWRLVTTMDLLQGMNELK